MSTSHSLLIIEDDNFMAALLTNSLSDAFTVKIANSFANAKSMLSRFVPDVFIIDYFLPDATGTTIYEELSKTFPDAIYIVLSANESPKNVLDLVKIGLRNYVVKDENAVFELKKILNEELNIELPGSV